MPPGKGSNADPIVPGRSCDGCALCCMVFKIEELSKPKGVWCDHCSSRQSCDIYDRRPDECKAFYCGWLTNESLGEDWKPINSKIVLAAEQDANRVGVHVHTNRPNAWKTEPYYSALKALARSLASQGGQVVVYIGRRTHVVFPDRDIDLGIVDEDHRILTGQRKTPFGIQLEALKVHKDDPRLQ